MGREIKQIKQTNKHSIQIRTKKYELHSKKK